MHRITTGLKATVKATYATKIPTLVGPSIVRDENSNVLSHGLFCIPFVFGS